ncbi:MAG TPA: ABC transporter permease [Anaerolineales bacterium]|nr:ABC transporter permease [Anaerolineales bacterium]
MSSRRGLALGVYSWLFYLYLYLPILVLVIFSFNTQRLNLTWEGFTLHWYDVLFSDAKAGSATRNTLMVAILSTITSTAIGTLAALALHRYEFRLRGFSETSLYIPIVIPEIVMGIGLLSLYALLKINLGLTTITLSHIAFSIPFVALVVRARLHGFDRSVEEAAMDLGANELVTFWRVTLPLILPGVLSGAMLAFTLSLDDFIITFFTAGPGSTTLPLLVYGMVKTHITPEINALSTIWVVTVFVLLFLSQVLQRRSAAPVPAAEELAAP